MLPYKVFLERILYAHYIYGYFVIKSRSTVWQYFFSNYLGSAGCCVACHPSPFLSPFSPPSLFSFFYLYIFLYRENSKSLFGWRFCLFKSSSHWLIGHSGILRLCTVCFKFHEITFILNWCKIKKSDWRQTKHFKNCTDQAFVLPSIWHSQKKISSNFVLIQSKPVNPKAVLFIIYSITICFWKVLEKKMIFLLALIIDCHDCTLLI